MIRYSGRVSPKEVDDFIHWVFHVWCDYEQWHLDMKPDCIRILGFEWEVIHG